MSRLLNRADLTSGKVRGIRVCRYGMPAASVPGFDQVAEHAAVGFGLNVLPVVGPPEHVSFAARPSGFREVSDKGFVQGAQDQPCDMARRSVPDWQQCLAGFP